MTKTGIMVWAILGFNIWSVFGRTFCGSKGQCHGEIDKRAENQLLKPLPVFKKHHKFRQYQDIPIPKELVFPRNTIIHKLGRFMYPVRVRISRSQLKKHLKSRKGKMYNQSKIPVRRKTKHFKDVSHHQKERLRRTMNYTYRKRCIFLPQDAVQLIKNLHLQKMRQSPVEGVLCRVGSPSRFIASPRYYG